MDETEKKSEDDGEQNQDRPGSASTSTGPDGSAPGPEETSNSASTAPPGVKPYLESIDATGARTQKIFLLGLGVLTVLFFGLLLPSLSALQKVRDLRAEENHLQFQIDVHNRKAEARRAAITHRRKTFFANGFKPQASGQNNTCGPKLPGELDGAKLALDELDYELANQASARNPKENPGQSVRELIGQVDSQLRTIEQKKDKDDSEEKKQQKQQQALQEKRKDSPQQRNAELEQINQEDEARKACLRTGLRQLRDRFGLSKLKAQQADVANRLSAESSRTIPLGFLGLFGLKIEGLDEARVPLLYLPLLWSLVLLALLLFVSHARSSMLNIYARALRVVDQSALLKELGPLSRSRWWWLAPLPRRNGTKVTASSLKLALGWARFELVAFFAVVLTHAGLLGMQAVVVFISWRATPILIGGGELMAISIAIGLFALWGVTIIFDWLWPWRVVPDFDANEEAPWHYRRAVVSMLVIGLAGVVLLRSLAPAAEKSRIHRSPRFRKRRPKRAVIVKEPLSVGFYLNKCSAVIHYVSLRKFPEPTHPRKRRKRRRIRLLRIETRRRHNVDADSRAANRLPKRQRQPTLERHESKPETANPKDLLIRGVSRINQRPQNFAALKIEKVFAKPVDSGSPIVVEPKSGPAKPAVARPMVQLPANRKPCSSDAPRLHASQAPFAIEQAALTKLALIKQTPNISTQQATDELNAVISLLQQGISNGGGKSYLRLYDLLAIVALRNNRKDILDSLVSNVGEDSFAELKARARRWAGEGKWRSRWSLNQDIGYRYKRKEWSGLPM